MAPVSTTGFRHEACFYAGDDAFVGTTLPFVRAGLEADEAILVVVDAPKLGWLRDALGSDAEAISFADMGVVGHNPARIIPAWARFLGDATAAGRTARGIGEPINARRSPAAMRECHLHESLLNNAFGGLAGEATPWWLLCPYDTTSLDPAVLADARRTHPFVDDDPSELHRHLDSETAFAEPLPEPAPGTPVDELAFDHSTLRLVREAVRAAAERAGLHERVADIVLAANELATNSTRHGGGHGRLRSWREGSTLVLEVRDAGHITDPLVGRIAPSLDRVGGRGVWMCNQLCDLVQVQSSPAGTAVRLHVDVAGDDADRSYVST